MSIIYTQIHLSLTTTGGSLVVASDHTPGAEHPAYVAVMGGGWLQEAYGKFIPPGYYPLTGDDAEEVVHQAQQVGFEEGALQRLADVIWDLVTQDTQSGPVVREPVAVHPSPQQTLRGAEVPITPRSEPVYRAGATPRSPGSCRAMPGLDGGVASELQPGAGYRSKENVRR